MKRCSVLTMQVQFCKPWGRAQQIWALSQAFWETMTHWGTHEPQDLQYRRQTGNVPKPCQMRQWKLPSQVEPGKAWRKSIWQGESAKSTGWVCQSTSSCEGEARRWPDYCLPFRRDHLGWWHQDRWRNCSIALRRSQLLGWESYLDIFVSKKHMIALTYLMSVRSHFDPNWMILSWFLQRTGVLCVYLCLKIISQTHTVAMTTTCSPEVFVPRGAGFLNLA